MQKNLYEILGVETTASAIEIKKAHRNLVKIHHPDVSKDPLSAEKFKDIQEAYTILSDEEKRATYDRHGYEATQESYQQQSRSSQNMNVKVIPRGYCLGCAGAILILLIFFALKFTILFIGIIALIIFFFVARRR